MSVIKPRISDRERKRRLFQSLGAFENHEVENRYVYAIENADWLTNAEKYAVLWLLRRYRYRVFKETVTHLASKVRTSERSLYRLFEKLVEHGFMYEPAGNAVRAGERTVRQASSRAFRWFYPVHVALPKTEKWSPQAVLERQLAFMALRDAGCLEPERFVDG